MFFFLSTFIPRFCYLYNRFNSYVLASLAEAKCNYSVIVVTHKCSFSQHSINSEENVNISRKFLPFFCLSNRLNSYVLASTVNAECN